MAKAGFRRIDNDIFRALIGAKITGAGYQVVLVVIDRTLGFRKGNDYKEEAKISLSYFEELTGLSRRGVIDAIKKLEEKNIISAIRNGAHRKTTIYALNHPNLWLTRELQLPNKLVKPSYPDKVTTVHQASEVGLSTQRSTKETLKETLKEREPHPIDIFDESITPHPKETRLKASSTSLEAIAVRDVSHQGKSDTLTVKIVSYLQGKGSLSPQELSIALGFPIQSIRIRLSLAKKQGLVTNVERGKWAAVDGQKPPQNISQNIPFRIPVRVGAK